MSAPLSVSTYSKASCLGLLIVCMLSLPSLAGASVQTYEIALPVLNPTYSPVAVENRPLLLDRLIMAFGRDYAAYYLRNQDRRFNDGMTVYYLQRELQAFIDMYRATGYSAYLDQATNLTLQAIAEATADPRMLIWHGEPRGEWPCFYLDKVYSETGGHNQLCDFQGSAGFLIVARVLQEINLPAWKEIADFVERDVVEKWLYYTPAVTKEHLQGPESNRYLLAVLNSGRDVREHFACICLDLHKLGYDRYPYRRWAALLVDLYLTPRYDANQVAPYQDEVPDRIPDDWGLYDRTEETYVWLSIPHYGFDPNVTTEALDTSHANRTVWLAARACEEGLIGKDVVLSLTNTLRFRIWTPANGPFYFTNYADGTDDELNGLDAGRGGNVWFGWHRLAAYDPDLEDLFLSIAYDLTNGGPNLPRGAQNKTMQDAPLCLEAWAARLLSSQGRPRRFP
jgi:hypothetical protein